jgi:3-oxoadipate enol-lactonase
MPVVTVNDNNLYYEVYGVGDPLVFIHGFAVDHLVFSAMPEEYQDNYQVFLIDNRGSGQSDCPDGPYTVEMMADDVAEFCRILELGRCHFVGHSLGGMILQRLIHQYPEQVRSATLCCTDVKIDIRYALVAQARFDLMVAEAPLRALIENGLGWTFSSDFLQRPGIIETIINLRLSNPYPITIAGYKNQLNALLTFNSTAWINQIQVPCLVLSGEQDIIVTEFSTRKMSTLIPQAHYESIPGVGHAPFLEKPEAFHAILKHFLEICA